MCVRWGIRPVAGAVVNGIVFVSHFIRDVYELSCFLHLAGHTRYATRRQRYDRAASEVVRDTIRYCYCMRAARERALPSKIRRGREERGKRQSSVHHRARVCIIIYSLPSEHTFLFIWRAQHDITFVNGILFSKCVRRVKQETITRGETRVSNLRPGQKKKRPTPTDRISLKNIFERIKHIMLWCVTDAFFTIICSELKITY